MTTFIIFGVIVLLVAIVFYGKHVKERDAQTQLKREHDRACALLQHEFVVVDLETTGLDPGRHTIIEIGAIKVTPAMVAAPSATAET